MSPYPQNCMAHYSQTVQTEWLLLTGDIHLPMPCLMPPLLTLPPSHQTGVLTPPPNTRGTNFGETPPEMRVARQYGRLAVATGGLITVKILNQQLEHRGPCLRLFAKFPSSVTRILTLQLQLTLYSPHTTCRHTIESDAIINSDQSNWWVACPYH